ncbi:Rad61 [Kluyveromyces lactis]|nr:Rad61 [Kluyveromyces lactis]
MKTRVYGHYGKFQALAKRHLNRKDNELSDEDNFTSTDEEETSLSTDLDRTHETSPMAPVREEYASSSHKYESFENRDSKIIEADPFDILDGMVSTSMKKKRKVTRLHKRVSVDNDDMKDAEEAVDNDSEMHEFQNTIDSISSMISSLKDSDDVISTYSQVKCLKVVSTSAASQVRYGRTRTLLKKEFQSDEELQEEASNVDEDDENNEGILEDQHHNTSFNDSNSVIHVNQLKTLGEGLKFEDDLDFLQFTTNDENLFVVKLISCCLLLLNNTELTSYTQKYKGNEVWNWFLQQINPENNVMSYLQLWIANLVPLPRSSPQWQQLSPLLMTCSSLTENPKLIQGSKITKLNYTDFIQRAETNPQDLTFTLWEFHLDPNNNEFSKLIESLNNPTPRLFDLVEQHLDKFITEEMMSNLYPKMLRHLSSYIEDISIIKIMVKLTNHAFFLSLLSPLEKVKIVRACLSYIIKVREKVESEQDTDDIVILQLGLVLNIVAKDTIKIENSITEQIQDMIGQSKSESFLKQLLALVFVLHANTTEWNHDLSTTASITKLLKNLSNDMKDTNETIYNNVQTALTILKKA